MARRGRAQTRTPAPSAIPDDPRRGRARQGPSGAGVTAAARRTRTRRARAGTARLGSELRAAGSGAALKAQADTGAGARSLTLSTANLAARAAARLGQGRPRLSREEIAENHRQRIMFATSQVVQEPRLHSCHRRRDRERRRRGHARVLPSLRRQAGGLQRNPRAQVPVPAGRVREAFFAGRAGPGGSGRRFAPR